MTSTDIFNAVDGYIGELFAREDEALSAALEEMRKEGLPDIAVSPVSGKLLHVLAKLAGARRILELGTLGGYSAIWMGRALPENGQLITLEADPLHVKVAKHNLARAKLLGIVEVREGRALDLLPKIEEAGGGPFDMIFIDADKEPYLEYFEWALRLSRRGTLIVADNVVRQGRVVDPAAASDPFVAGVMRMSQAAAKNPAVDATIIQSVGTKGHDGMLLAVVK
jgi:caffeoyl-CoA O-methyltransferase